MRCCPRKIVLLLLLLLLPAGVSPAEAQEGSFQDVALERVLAHFGVRTILAGAGAQVWARVSEVAAGLPAPEEARIMDAVRAEFTLEHLYGDVMQVLESEGGEGEVQALLAHLEEGATAEVRRLGAEQVLEGSFDDFTRRLQDNRPPRDRLDLVLQWTVVQGTVDFHLLVGESARRAAHAVLDAGLQAGVPYESLGELELLDLRERLAAGAFLSHLRQLEPVPDSLLQAALGEASSSLEVAWWNDVYGLAVGVALRRAGERAAARLGTGVDSPR
jgi:hypothetical protein